MLIFVPDVDDVDIFLILRASYEIRVREMLSRAENDLGTASKPNFNVCSVN